MNPENVIEIDHVSKKYCRNLKRVMWYGGIDIARDVLGVNYRRDVLRPKEFWATNDVSFELRNGECLGIIGHNGAGKSTMLKMLNGIIKPDKGEIRVRGRLEALIEVGAGFHPQLSGRENVYVAGAVLGMNKRTIDRKFDQIAAFADIDDFLDTPVKFYSSGMQVRLGMAVSLHTEPDILLIDEVFAVGDVGFQSKCLNRIAELRRSGVSFIMVSHNIHMIGSYAHRVICLAHGEVLASGDPDEAIAAYMKTMRYGMATSAGLPEEAQANGSGRVTINRAYFAKADGEPSSQFQADEPVLMRLEYTAEESFHDVELDILLRTGDNRSFYQGTNVMREQRLDLPAGRGVVEVQFPCIPTNLIFLTCDVALWENGRHELFDWRRQLNIEVHGCPRSSGLCWLNADYQVSSVEESVTERS